MNQTLSFLYLLKLTEMLHVDGQFYFSRKTFREKVILSKLFSYCHFWEHCFKYGFTAENVRLKWKFNAFLEDNFDGL